MTVLVIRRAMAGRVRVEFLVLGSYVASQWQLSVAMARGVLAAGRARRDDAYLPNNVYLLALIVVSKGWTSRGGVGRVGNYLWAGRRTGGRRCNMAWPTAQLDALCSGLACTAAG
jgi:hypothetical protein